MAIGLPSVRVSYKVAKRIAGLLRDENARGLLDRAEEADPQMRAVEKIRSRIGRSADAAFYVVGVATISYQLSAKGEVHWSLAAEFATNDPLQSLRDFAARSPSLRLARQARLARVEKLARYYPVFVARYREYLQNPLHLWKDVAEALGADPYSKTVVFSVKMFYYAAKVEGLKVHLPTTIPLPVDRRVCLISLASRLVEGYEPTLEGARKLLQREAKLVADAWSLVGELSGVPPLKIDALLWLLGGCYERSPLEALDCALGLLRPASKAELSLLEVLLGLSP